MTSRWMHSRLIHDQVRRSTKAEREQIYMTICSWWHRYPEEVPECSHRKVRVTLLECVQYKLDEEMRVVPERENTFSDIACQGCGYEV